jgi:Putative lactococcus lactis phage r1t holin
MFSRKWWRATWSRAARTGAQTLIGFVGFDATGFRELDVTFIGTAIGVFMLLSFANSIIQSPVTEDE